MINKVAIVTGANKGIGFGIVKELCRRGVSHVYLTSRDVKKGLEAVNNLKREGYNPFFHQLDITNEESVIRFAGFVKIELRGIDILFNNAAVAGDNVTGATYEDAKNVISVNFDSILTIEKYIFPLLNNNARVINMSSDLGHLSKLKNKYWINTLSKDNLTLENVKNFTDWFLDAVRNNTLKEEDFSLPYFLSYVVSKIALSAYTRIQQKKIERGISINSLHPGFVKTSMTKDTGMLTIEQASDAPVYLALDADQSIKGKYVWFDKTEKDWTNISLDLNYIDPSEFKELLDRRAKEMH
ncbi:(+)-neomenthol dehydrogenase-like [Pieris rapae]|uniref:(+)-neomenthol dehydrogenase-like n=1 Tax=Pieris rapae TaxID=64459 RepID=UPI001E27B6C5|nr:(+)-neomenthol dehydrogenase-like [Pieris rapae]